VFVDRVVVDFDDARMRELRQRVELAREQLLALAALVEVGAALLSLERQSPAGLAVQHQVYERHAATAQFCLQLVAAGDQLGLRAWYGV
jgi:hypothetical protein